MAVIITNSSASPGTGCFAVVLFADQGRSDVARELLSRSLASKTAFAYRGAAEKLPAPIK